MHGIFTQSSHASQLFTYLEVYIDDCHLTVLCLHQQFGCMLLAHDLLGSLSKHFIHNR